MKSTLGSIILLTNVIGVFYFISNDGIAQYTSMNLLLIILHTSTSVYLMISRFWSNSNIVTEDIRRENEIIKLKIINEGLKSKIEKF
jgi:magnesium-transporting ATPase (P-type)